MLYFKKYIENETFLVDISLGSSSLREELFNSNLYHSFVSHHETLLIFSGRSQLMKLQLVTPSQSLSLRLQMTVHFCVEGFTYKQRFLSTSL